LNRREFLGVGALPLAAGLAAKDFGAEDLGAKDFGAEDFDAESTSSGRKVKSMQSSQATVRVGLMGAGGVVQRAQLPNFRRIPGCEVVAVANRSLASSQRVAEAFDIPMAYANWKELLEDESIDAVMIGTPPYMHRILTLEGLEHGKHVLCQSRMAMNGQEARDMLEGARRHPDLVCQLVVNPYQRALKRLIDDGYLGELLSAEIRRLGSDASAGASPDRRRGFVENGQDLHWRVDPEFNGFNIPLGLGAAYESMSPLLGRATRVVAMSKVHAPQRRAADGEMVSKGGVDHVDILYEVANGAQIHLRVSTTTAIAGGNRTWLFGSEGTLQLDGRRILGARRGDSELREIPNSPQEPGVRRVGVEERFINTIRGTAENTTESLEIGVDYMEFSEAVHRSAQTGLAMDLPL
jgi:predicted dehydrogenase